MNVLKDNDLPWDNALLADLEKDLVAPVAWGVPVVLARVI